MTVIDLIKQIKAECVGCYEHMKIGFWCVKIDEEWCIAEYDDPNAEFQERWV